MTPTPNRTPMHAPLHFIEEDLSWYWCWSDGDMGLRSIHAPMVARLECGGRVGGAPILDLDERCLEAATRHRTITRALERLSDDQVRVLRVAYGPQAHRLPGLDQPACVAAACTLAPAARQAHAESSTTRSFEEWLVRFFARSGSASCGPQDRVLARRILAEASALLAAAGAAYGAARSLRGMR